MRHVEVAAQYQCRNKSCFDLIVGILLQFSYFFANFVTALPENRLQVPRKIQDCFREELESVDTSPNGLTRRQQRSHYKM